MTSCCRATCHEQKNVRSMHMFDHERRFMGGYAIVGETCPIAVGIAYAVAMRGLPEVVVCFLGDGAVNQGTFHELLNMAGLWRLPILFVCENNHYAIGTEIHRHSAVPEVFKRVAAYNIPAERLKALVVLKDHEQPNKRSKSHQARRRPAIYRMRDLSLPRPFHGRSRRLSACGRTQGASELGPDRRGDPQCRIQLSDAERISGGRAGRHQAVRRSSDRRRAPCRSRSRGPQKEIQQIVDDAVAFASQSAQPTMDAAWGHLNRNQRHGADYEDDHLRNCSIAHAQGRWTSKRRRRFCSC